MLDHFERTGEWPASYVDIDSGIDDIVEDVRAENMKRGTGLYNLFYNWAPFNPSKDQVIVAIDRWLEGSNNPWNADDAIDDGDVC